MAAGLPGEPAIDRVTEMGIAQPEIIVGDPAAAREQLEGELHRFKVEVTLDRLEVGLTLLGGTLKYLDDRFAL